MESENTDGAAISTKISSYGSWSGELLGQDISMTMTEDSEGEDNFADLESYLIKMCDDLLDD